MQRVPIRNWSHQYNQNLNQGQPIFTSNQNNQNPQLPINNHFPNKCRIQRCLEAHSKHYCKNCQNPDSDHFHSNCPGLSQYDIRLNNNQVFSCKVQGCNENHQFHYCKVCKNKDSDHFSSSCQPGIKNIPKESEDLPFWQKFLGFFGYSLPKKLILPFQHESSWDMLSPILEGFRLKTNISWSNDMMKIYRVASDEKDRINNIENLFEAVKIYPTLDFFGSLLPFIASLALDVETQKEIASLNLNILIKGKTNTIVLNRYQIACILSYLFFGLIPNRGQNDLTQKIINFGFLFNTYAPVKTHKILCILNYFRRIQSLRIFDPKRLKEKVKYIRKCINSTKNIDDWCQSKEKLMPFEMKKYGSIEEQIIDNKLEVDFANKFVGGGALTTGSVQEEIMFMNMPECVPSILFMESLTDNEVAYIVGVDRINKCSGYKQNFQFLGDFYSQNAKSTIVAMDAIPFKVTDDQFNEGNILRELNKAYIGFDYNEDNLKRIVTGKWGCGVFNGNPLLKFIIQWVAASECKKEMVFCTLGDVYFKNIENLLRLYIGKNIGKMIAVISGYSNNMKNISFEEYLGNILENNN